MPEFSHRKSRDWGKQYFPTYLVEGMERVAYWVWGVCEFLGPLLVSLKGTVAFMNSLPSGALTPEKRRLGCLTQCSRSTGQDFRGKQRGGDTRYFGGRKWPSFTSEITPLRLAVLSPKKL